MKIEIQVHSSTSDFSFEIFHNGLNKYLLGNGFNPTALLYQPDNLIVQVNFDRTFELTFLKQAIETFGVIAKVWMISLVTVVE